MGDLSGSCLYPTEEFGYGKNDVGGMNGVLPLWVGFVGLGEMAGMVVVVLDDAPRLLRSWSAWRSSGRGCALISFFFSSLPPSASLSPSCSLALCWPCSWLAWCFAPGCEENEGSLGWLWSEQLFL